MSLPYKIPDNDLTLNISILLIVVVDLGKTARGRLLLNNERLQVCMHLLKNPIHLNWVLAAYGQTKARLNSYDEYSVASISSNLDPLHDNKKIKEILQHAAALELIRVEYRKSDGFMYDLSPAGEELINVLKGDYYETLRSYARSLTQLNSISTANLADVVNKNKGRFAHEFD